MRRIAPSKMCIRDRQGHSLPGDYPVHGRPGAGMTQTRPWFRKEPGGRVGTLAKCLFIFLQGEGFALAGATKGLSDRPLETFGAHACGRFCRLRKRKAFLLRFSLERQTRPGSLRNRGAPDCQKTFGRCRRGCSPSDFHSCKPALPADGWLFERKAKSLRDRCFSLRKNSALLGC